MVDVQRRRRPNNGDLAVGVVEVFGGAELNANGGGLDGDRGVVVAGGL